MAPLSTFSLPLPPTGPPDGYGWEERDMSIVSTTTAFNTGLDQRDTFLGERRCVVCGRSVLQRCHIIMKSDPKVWVNLKKRRWIPNQAKDSPQHEPRNGLLMCLNHHALFHQYSFFIRFVPEARKFVFISYSDDTYGYLDPDLTPYHGKAIAIDIDDPHAPFPSPFIIHEMRIRGHNAFHPAQPDIDVNDIKWQDWVYASGVFDDSTNLFKRKREKTSLPDDNPAAVGSIQPPFNVTTSNPPGASSGLTLDDNTINEILFATRNSASWKACQMEGTSWAGTADENIQKYITSIGVEEPSPSIDPPPTHDNDN